MKDFFVSYTGVDSDWAEWIAWELEAAGFEAVIQVWDFLLGSNFVLHMDEAVKTSERTIAVLSPDYLDAVFTQPEWAAAFVQDPTGFGRKLIPVRVRECKPEGLLKAIVYVDLAGLNEESARDRLLAGVEGKRGKPPTRPQFPGAKSATVGARPAFPGGSYRIWNVPHRRNPNFTGRRTYLTRLRKALTSGKPAALTQAVSGLGGVGKTQLAVEYAYEHRDEYPLVWWVRAEEPATLASDYAALATELDLPERDESRPARDQARCAALAGGPRRLAAGLRQRTRSQRCS